MTHKFILKKGLPLVTLLLLCSCSVKHSLIGAWQANHYSLWEKGIAYLKGVRGFVVGSELDINSDSTYKMIDCWELSIGKWYIKGDSLVLSNDTIIAKDKQHLNLILEKKELTGRQPKYKYQAAYLIRKNKLIHYNKGIFYAIEKDPKDSSLKSVKPHKTYSIEILKPVN